MDITYLGHSCFKIKTTNATVVTDPFDKSVGFDMPRVSADIVTISHQHGDHNHVSTVNATARRDKPFLIDAVGEYEVGGVSVFGIRTYHDDAKGEKRGENIVYSILMDNISVVHLGDIGHTLKQSQISDLGTADILLCPVGGHYTIDPKQVGDLVSQLEPSIFIPMHYKTEAHDKKTFESLITLEEFLKVLGSEATTTDKLTISKSNLPEEMEVVVLTN